MRSNSNFAKAIKQAFKYDEFVLLEDYINGRELTCGVLEKVNGSKILTLPSTEIIPRKGNKFFNYSAKYTPGAAEEITPATVSDELTKQVSDTAIAAHNLLGCHGYSRSDMICKGNKVYLLEINTLPGLTKNSLVPQQAKAAGLEFKKLLDIIISNA